MPASPRSPTAGALRPSLAPTSAPTASAAIAQMATAVPTVQARPTVEAPRPPGAAPTALAARGPSVGTPAPVLEGRLITSTARLDLYQIEGGLTITALLDLAPQFEQAIDRVGEHIQARLLGRVALSFEPAQRGPCALRGLTLSHQRIIRLYYAPDTPQERVLAVVAHELAHELQHDYYGWAAHQKSDLILLEGQATWASSQDALDTQGRPSWQSAAEQALAEGRLLPLDVSLEADCRTATRNSAYTGWASFVAFLMRDGRERFDALYRSSRGHRPGSADYTGVYGKSLHELDQEWRVWLDEQRRAK
ncbi:MAG TPA: hypothetical protein VKE41_03245 [Roseiflexaceae bacterium]|nr:hypothetical protein [Roseiflexaceae bacterium]